MPCFSVRGLMVLFCSALTFTTALVSLLITFSFSLGAARDIATQHAASLASKAQGDVENFLAKPLGAVSGMQYQLLQNHHPLPKITEPTNPEWYLWWWEQAANMMKAADFKYQFAVVGFNDGNYAGCKLIGSSEKFQCRVFSMRSREATGKSWRFQRDYNITTHALIEESSGSTSYDPRTRVWYHMVEHKPMAMEWSSVYLSVSPTLPIVDVNAALFNGTNDLLGVISLTFELGALSDFVANLETTSNTRGVLLDKENMLLASSYSEPFLTEEPIPATYNKSLLEEGCLKSDTANDATSSVKICRKSIRNYDWPALQELASADPELLEGGAEGVKKMELQSEDHYVVVAKIDESAVSKGMNWRYVLIMPEKDITAGIITGRNIAIYIVTSFIVFTSVVAFIVVRVVLRPLDRLSERMYKTAYLQDHDEAEAPSSLHEVYTIQLAYELMVAELEKVKSYLPQSIMAALYGDAADNSETTDEDEGDFQDVVSSTSQVSCTSASATRSSRVTQLSSSKNSFVLPGGVTTPKNNRKNSNMSRTSGFTNSTAVGSAHTNQPVALKTTLKLVTRKVSVVALNLCGFNVTARAIPTDDLIRGHGDILNIINTRVHENKGVIDSFHGDRVFATFNAVTNVGSHAQAAARTALMIRDEILSRKSKFKVEGLTCGIASGQAQVGNIGTGGLRRFCTLGPVYGIAAIMERLCKKYGEPKHGMICLSGLAVMETENFFEFQYLDVITVPSGQVPVTNRRVRLAALKDFKDAACDEWMYQIQENNSKSIFGLFNEAFSQFCDGSVATAKDTLRKYQDTVLNVEPCPLNEAELRIVSQLEQLLQHGADPRQYVNPLYDFYGQCLANSEMNLGPLANNIGGTDG